MPKTSRKDHCLSKVEKYTPFLFDSSAKWRKCINSQQKNNFFKKDIATQTYIANRLSLKKYLICRYLDNDDNSEHSEKTTRHGQSLEKYPFNIGFNHSGGYDYCHCHKHLRARHWQTA